MTKKFNKGSENGNSLERATFRKNSAKKSFLAITAKETNGIKINNRRLQKSKYPEAGCLKQLAFLNRGLVAEFGSLSHRNVMTRPTRFLTVRC
ncbi:hypothetical protein MGI18_18560 [Bacillus sp. OVS6]|nr:hypothetical protein MGI18_18560 [Bacillus sp. OVS6]